MTSDTYTTPAKPNPPAADISGAIAQTQQALMALTDADRMEQIAVVCLQEFAPTLRRSGGSGDQQRDAVGGPLRTDGDDLVVTVSLEKTWGKKIERDLDGLKGHGHTPKDVWAVTNRKTGASRRGQLERDAPERWGHRLRVLDVRFLALRLLTPDLLTAREELLGLPTPAPPITLDADTFAERLPDLGAPGHIVGRQDEVAALDKALREAVTVELSGPGGIGKTRLALATAERLDADRVRFLDERTPVDSDRVHAELAGADRLVLVVDNSHRREDLHVLVGLLAARTGPTRLLLVTRPGFSERLRQATGGTAFGVAGAHREVELLPLSNAFIGELVRAARPQLEFAGAVDEIVALAEGNPLIALLAHRVAVERGGLHGLSRGDVLGQYAESAVATAVQRRPDVAADDLLDTLAVASALGPIGEDDHQVIADLLQLSTRVVRNRLADLADVGLLVDSGGQGAIAPDLLAAHVLREAYFSERLPALRYREIWDAADEARRDRMCAALGGLQRFEFNDRAGVEQLITEALTAQAAEAPAAALSRAQSLAAGLPGAAVAVIDAVLDAAGKDRPRLCRVAMEVLSRVGDFSIGWPRQLAVAQACYASDYGERDDKAIRDGLTEVYKRLPINTSRFDGQVLALVQEVLDEVTSDYCAVHRGEPGATMAVAVAAGQMLRVVSERSYLSPENDRQVRMSAGFLPAGERTARLLRTGSRLLGEVLAELPVAEQQRALEPLAALRRTAGGYAGPFGSTPDEALVELAREVVAENVAAYKERAALPLPTRSRLVDALGDNPWPQDDELRAFHGLLAHRGRLDRDVTSRERAETTAADLLAAEDMGAELRRWEEWLVEADEAQMKHAGRWVVSRSLVEAARRDRERVEAALTVVLASDGELNELAGPALCELLEGDGAEHLARRLLVGASPPRRAAVANGLAGSAEKWADEMLVELAEDEHLPVRRSVALAGGWTPGGSSVRVLTGLRACLPDDVGSAAQLLGGLRSREVDLDGSAVSVVDELALNAARSGRIDASELVEMVELAQRPQAAVQACVARVKWLMDQPQDFESMMARDSMPDELAEVVRAGAQDGDVAAVLDLIESGGLNSEARSAAVRLLSWLDRDADLVTDRMIHWLREQDSELEYVVSSLLNETRDPEQFRARAQRMLAATPPIEVADLLVEAREPRWMMGSERVIYGRIAHEFDTWASSDDERVAAVGRAGAARFRDRAARADGADEDPDAEAG